MIAAAHRGGTVIGSESVGGEGVVTPETAPTEAVASTVRRQLRLALAMRGGVSLAVWIGGAVSEIDRLRRGVPADKIYRQLLEANGYDDVIVDVVSGASAGGLNGVVFAAAQVHGFSMGALRDLWLQLGDLELLARETTPGERARSAAVVGRPITRTEALRPSSLLRGDEYFYEQLKAVLTDRIAGAEESGPVVDRIELILSATLFTPERVKRPVNATTVVEDGRSQAVFHFSHSQQEGGDFSGDEAAVSSGPAKLAMAGRSTSSFPAAFEPARIALGSAGAEEAVDGLDFAGTFEVPAVSTATGFYEVIDGGVLDNIPVAAAIDAVVNARADGPTERWLCYLHPSPAPMGSGDRPVARERSRGLATTIRTFATRFNQESVLEDIDELRLVNDVLVRRRLVRETLLAPFGLSNHEAVVDHVADPLTSKQLQAILAQFEAHRIRSSLERPDRLGLVPPMAQIGRWSAEAQFELRQALANAVEDRIADRGWASSLFVASEATDLLIAFARTVENSGQKDSRQRASDIKAELYALRVRHDELVRVEAETWNRVVTEMVVQGDDGSVLAAELSQAISRAIVEADLALARPSEALRRDLRAAARALADLDAVRSTPFSLLQSAEAGGRTGEVLEAVVLTLLPARLVGRGPWGEISFVYITGDAPVARSFPALANDQGRVGAKEKLCGNELANFAAFLSAKWRANDWMWGRMDAASTLVSALTPDRLFTDSRERARLAGLVGLAPDTEAETIREAIRGQLQDEILDEELPVVSTTPTSAIDKRGAGTDRALTVDTLDVGKEKVSDLGTLRRVRIGMRLAHLAYGAGRPGGESVVDTVVRLVLSLLKPLYLATVFAVISPALGTLAFSIGVASLQATFWRGVDDFDATFDTLTWLFVAATVITALPAIVGVLLVRHGDDRGQRWLSGSVPMLIVALPAALIAVLRDQGFRYLSLAVIAVAIIGLATYRVVGIVKAQRQADGTIDRNAFAWGFAIVVAVGGLFLGWAAPLWESSQQWSDVRPAVLFLLGAAVSVVVLANWWMRPIGLLLAVALTVTTGLGTLRLTDYGDVTIIGLHPSLWLWLSLALLAVVYLRDLDQLRRYCSAGTAGDRWLSTLLSATVSLFVLGAIGVAATLGDYRISIGAWAVTAVIAVSYATTVLATFFPVFPPPRPLEPAGPTAMASTDRALA